MIMNTAVGKVAVGHSVRSRAVSNAFWTKFLSHQPPSIYECQRQLRQQPQHWPKAGKILLAILENPRKFPLMRAFVIAGRWDKFESLRVPAEFGEHGGKTATDIVSGSESYPIARDKMRECRRWEASLSESMKAARCGNFRMFMYNVSVSPNALEEMDFLGYDLWFWALTGGDIGIIDYLLLNNLSLHWLVQFMLHRKTKLFRTSMVLS